MSDDRFEGLEIGEFSICRDLKTGRLSIHRHGGEMMELNEETESALETVLEQFWEAHF